MGAKEHMIEILRSGETSRINFSFKGESTGGISLGRTISIDGSAFLSVATGLENDLLHVEEGEFDENKMVYAARDDKGFFANTFYLGSTPRWSRDFNGLVVHESVHAYFDITSAFLKWVDNEAAAYIAQAYYLRNAGVSAARLIKDSELDIGTQIIGKMRSNIDATELIEKIRNSLLNNPDYKTYIGGNFKGDG